MANDLLDKLINRINFEHANNFELAVAKEYSFVPINVQGESFFVAICTDSDKVKITEYVKPIVNRNLEFIYLSKQNFDTLFNGFLKKFSSMHGSVVSSQIADNPFGNVAFGQKNEQQQAPQAQPQEVANIDDEDTIDLSLDDEDELDLDSEDSDALQSGTDEKVNASDSKEKPSKPHKDISSVQAPNTKKIGEILIEEGLINEKQLNMALAEAKASGIPLGSELVKMGFITVKDLKEALAAQMGVTLATSEQLKALPTAISILPEEFVRENKVIPLSMTDKSLVVGMVDPGIPRRLMKSFIKPV